MHPAHGAQALAQVNSLEEITLAVRHHERRGKDTDGLSMDDSLDARIISICDSYDAMTNDVLTEPH